MVNIGEKIKQYRLQLDLTQSELAERTELTKGYISQLENDLCSPSIATLQDISEKKHKEKIKREREAREKAEKEQLIAEKKRIKFLIDKFGEKQASLIIEKRIGIGMAEEALIESWGKPRNINESTGPWGVHRQYVYHSAYVYIENGSVVSWQIEK